MDTRKVKAMELKETIQRLKPYLPNEVEKLERAKAGGYICPHCGSGSGKEGTSALEVYQDSLKYYCHKCEKGGDIVDLYQAVHDCTKGDAIEALTSQYLGAFIPPKVLPKPKPKLPTNPQSVKNWQAVYVGSAGDKYIQGRGISTKVALDYGLGYDDRAGRVIIPTAKGSYIARAIDASVNPKVLANGRRYLFNEKALLKRGAVFVTEGEIDALTIIEAGYIAIGLGGTSQTRLLLDILEDLPKDSLPSLILALDNDEQGQKVQGELEAELKALEVPYRALRSVGGYNPLYGTAKDANEALTGNRDGFINNLETVLEDYASVKPLGDRLASIKAKMLNNADVIPILTDNIAKALPRGGLSKGLYVLGASPGMGKSALCQQIAEEVAIQGHKVLYLSFEMGEEELLTRTLVRTVSTNGQAMSAQEVEKRFLADSIPLVEELAENIYIEDFERKQPTLESVRAVFGHFMQLNHEKSPLVIVDYMQMIQLADKRENADTVTRLQTIALELRRLSRTCPFLVISSLNREGRKEEAPKLEAFQGSGSIEYSANWAGILWSVPTTKDEPPPPKGTKRVNLHCVKVRNGMARSTSLLFVGSQYRFIDADEPLKKPAYKSGAKIQTIRLK